MTLIAVAGLYTLETNLRIAGFPLEYEPVHFPFHAISQSHAGVGPNLAVALSGLGNTVRLASYVGFDELGVMRDPKNRAPPTRTPPIPYKVCRPSLLSVIHSEELLTVCIAQLPNG